ncbi:hypothetical protein SNE40_013243 [Patella caerulea]|uniref:Uncharacterized protein n=1 Tax=Patella caerulea TaxID=87958 RepID=A0AAN8PKW0_PATCE
MNPDCETSNSNDNLLRVENILRPRANSDPGVFTLPEIIVQDYSGESVSRKLTEAEDDFFSLCEPGRPRANTCPDDLFRKKHERPGTPPPVTGSETRRSGRFNFISPSRTCVSFAHHNLSKIIEDEGSGSGNKQSKGSFSKNVESDTDFADKLNKDFQLKLKVRDKKVPSGNGTLCGIEEMGKPVVTLR